MQQALNIYLSSIRELISEGEILPALELLTKLDISTNLEISNTLINLKGQRKRLQREVDEGYIDRRDLRIEVNRIQRAILNIVDNIPIKLKLRGKINGVTGYNFGVTDNTTFEKIINSTDNLLKINWLEKALAAAKSVCLVVGADGSRGTGFITENNYLITNNHVLPTQEAASQANIEFKFEEDTAGSEKERYRYNLDATDFITSDPQALDVTRVKVRDNPKSLPLAFWGHLELAKNTPPETGDPVTIIQHAAGEQKRIALNANEVLGQQDQYLFYQTDTQAGSSGSPVFNRNWEVVALHHAGSNFRNQPANRGILIKYIIDFFEKNLITTTPPADLAAETIRPSGPIPVIPSTRITNNSDRTKLFLIYDKNDDSDAAQQLRKHFSPFVNITKQLDIFDLHHDRRLGFGNPQTVITEQLAVADLVIALISPGFFSSSYELVDQAREMGKTIVPVLINQVDFFTSSFLGQLRSLPSDGKFVSEWSDEDSAYTDIVQQIRRILF